MSFSPRGVGEATGRIVLNVNGQNHSVVSPPDLPLLFVLRNELDLTGSKYGCGEGQCGACTVLVEGVARRSCMTPVGSVSRKQITTIEGLADGERLHPLQASFIECDAMQCGYCTPGMIMSSAGLLKKNPAPSVIEIKQALEGNICRCGTYHRIVAAVRKASAAITAEAKEPHRA